MPRRENKATPKVIGSVLYTATGGIRVESPEWWAWLELGLTFYFESSAGILTARCEGRPHSVVGRYWYAYRRHRQRKLYKCYLGKSAQLTMACLAQAAQVLADRAGA